MSEVSCIQINSVSYFALDLPYNGDRIRIPIPVYQSISFLPNLPLHLRDKEKIHKSTPIGGREIKYHLRKGRGVEARPIRYLLLHPAGKGALEKEMLRRFDGTAKFAVETRGRVPVGLLPPGGHDIVGKLPAELPLKGFDTVKVNVTPSLPPIVVIWNSKR